MAAGAAFTASPCTEAAPTFDPEALFAFFFSSRFLDVRFIVRLKTGESLMPGVMKSMCGAICSGT